MAYPGGPPQGYPPQGGYPPQQPPQGYPPQGYPPQGQPGYPPQGQPGYPPQGQPGYPPQGGPPPGYGTPPGYPPQGGPPPGAYGAPPPGYGGPPPGAYGAPMGYGPPPVAHSPQAGDVIHAALRHSRFGAYLTTNVEGDMSINHQEPPQRWTLEYVSPTVIALKSSFGRYLCAEKTLGMTGSVKCNRIERSGWECWKLFRLSSGRYTFESAHNKFLSATKSGGVNAKESKAQSDEEWDLLPA